MVFYKHIFKLNNSEKTSKEKMLFLLEPGIHVQMQF